MKVRKSNGAAAAVATANTDDRYVEFIHKAITALRNPQKSKGIHSVFSGFNAAFREHFNLEKTEGFAIVDRLAEEGKIEKHFARGGVMLYLPGEMPKQADVSAKKALAKILG